jgi:hypothetical protein
MEMVATDELIIWGYISFLFFFPIIINQTSKNYWRNMKCIGYFLALALVLIDYETMRNFAAVFAPFPLVLRSMHFLFPKKSAA